MVTVSLAHFIKNLFADLELARIALREASFWREARSAPQKRPFQTDPEKRRITYLTNFMVAVGGQRIQSQSFCGMTGTFAWNGSSARFGQRSGFKTWML
jgi:hypothetical protein